MSLQYRIYGLTISSDVELPELVPLPGPADPPDVLVTLCETRKIEEPSEWFHTLPLPTGEPFLFCARIEGGYLLRYHGLADFAILRGGREIVSTRREHRVSLQTLRHLLLDQVFPLVLNLLGKEAVHATAVLTRRGACAFIAPSGSGKSTVAASFLSAGYPVMGDDCLVLEARDRIFAVPAYPGLRLWRDAFEALAGDSDRPAPVAGYTYKARLVGPTALASFPREPQPLVRIYKVTRENGTPGRKSSHGARVAPMGARESFIELLSAPFPLDIADQAMLARQFRFFERVLAQVPVKRLMVPNDFSSLPAVRRAVLADLDGE